MKRAKKEGKKSNRFVDGLDENFIFIYLQRTSCCLFDFFGIVEVSHSITPDACGAFLIQLALKFSIQYVHFCFFLSKIYTSTQHTRHIVIISYTSDIYIVHTTIKLPQHVPIAHTPFHTRHTKRGATE